MIQSDHSGAGFKAKRSAKRTVSTASKIAGKRADRRTSGVEAFRRAERATAKTAGENFPRAIEVVVAGPANVVGKSVTGDDESLEGDDAPRQTYESTWTADNYVRLLRRSLTKECQSHIILNSSCRDVLKSAAAPELGEDAVAVLVKRAMTAVQVYLIYLYCSIAGRSRCASGTSCIV